MGVIGAPGGGSAKRNGRAAEVRVTPCLRFCLTAIVRLFVEYRAQASAGHGSNQEAAAQQLLVPCISSFMAIRFYGSQMLPGGCQGQQSKSGTHFGTFKSSRFPRFFRQFQDIPEDSGWDPREGGQVSCQFGQPASEGGPPAPDLPRTTRTGGKEGGPHSTS